MKRKPQQLNIQPKQKPKPQEKAKRDFGKFPDRYPCPVCGGKIFEWGYAIGAVYSEKQNPILSSDTQAMRARSCAVCGNVLMFLDS